MRFSPWKIGEYGHCVGIHIHGCQSYPLICHLCTEISKRRTIIHTTVSNVIQQPTAWTNVDHLKNVTDIVWRFSTLLLWFFVGCFLCWLDRYMQTTLVQNNAKGLQTIFSYKVHIFWEGHKILRNLHLTFDCYTAILKNLNFCANSARSKTWSRKNISWIERKSLLTKPSNVLPFLHIKLNWRKNSKRTKVRWRFRKILWPSQNIWTLSSSAFCCWAFLMVHTIHKYLVLYVLQIYFLLLSMQ